MKLILEDQLTALAMWRGETEISPLVIVEGVDDVPIYEAIVKVADKANLIIYPIEYFDGYSEGCESLIKAISDSQSFFTGTANAEQLFLGIIDADSRKYRTLQPNEIDINLLKGIFVLKYYSIETYFATRVNLSRFIIHHTLLSEKEVTNEILDFVEKTHFHDLSELYYISLECLQKILDQSYNAAVTYGEKSIKEDKQRKHIMSVLATKITDLDSFAQAKSLSINDIRAFCKGKFYLYSFVYKTYQQIQNLQNDCGVAVPKCQNCLIIAKNCKYVPNAKLQYDSVYQHFLTLVDEEECADLIQKFRALA